MFRLVGGLTGHDDGLIFLQPVASVWFNAGGALLGELRNLHVAGNPWNLFG